MALTALSTQTAGGTATASWANTNKTNWDTLIAAWTAYTPALVNATLGNGTVTGSYLQMGKTVFFTATFTLGSTSAVSTSPTISIPVAANAAAYVVSGAAYDTSANALFALEAEISSSGTTARLAAGAGNVSSTVPFTWATGDNIVVSGVYQST